MSIEQRTKQYGAVFGNWRILKLLGTGSGGKSAVFELYRDNQDWKEYCALKVINLVEERGTQDELPQNLQSEYSTIVHEQRQTAEHEVRLMEQLRGKTNIVDYLDHQFLDWQDETGFGVDLLIRMEKLKDLRSELRRGRFFREEEVIQIARAICQALVICHHKNILHRDIKPENIFFNSDGDYKLGDFGVSRVMDGVAAAQAGTMVGTPAYAAPEQFLGGYDKRVDIYSLGIVLYELCNGNKLPFSSTSYISQEALNHRYSGVDLPLPERFQILREDGGTTAGSELCRIIMKACAHKPENRYQSADEMLSELNMLLGLPAGVYQTGTQNPMYTVGRAAAAAAHVEIPKKGDAASRLPENDDFNGTTVLTPPVPEKPVKKAKAKKEKKKGKGILIAVLAVILALAVAAVLLRKQPKHEHSWRKATCTDPRTCSDCGETEGVALGHKWSDATCDTPETCSRCGETQGDVLEHQWQDDAETGGTVCTLCGLTEAPAIVITLQPENASAEEGHDVTLTVEATGEGLTYTWWARDKGDANFYQATAFISNTYTVPMDAARDGREVYCVIADANGNSVTTNTVILELIVPPIIITQQPLDAEAGEGETITLTVEATGEGLTYAWWARDKGDTNFYLATSFVSNIYTVPMDAGRDGREVYCIITDANGNTLTTNTVKLTLIIRPIVITQQPKDAKAREGEKITLTVEATGEGLTYAWWARDKGDSKYYLSPSFTSTEYTVPMSPERDGREVYCVITDAHGNFVTSKTVTLTMITD